MPFSFVCATPNTSEKLLTTAEQVREAKLGMKHSPTIQESHFVAREEQNWEMELSLSSQGRVPLVTELSIN